MAVLSFLISGALADEPPLGQTFLSSTSWSASAYSHHADGAVCWLIGDDGSLRIEILRNPNGDEEQSNKSSTGVAVDIEPLMTWTGDGWTLVLGPDGSGTLNAWGREWEQVPEGLSQMARLITTALQNFPSRPADLPFASSVGQSSSYGGIPRPGMLDSNATGQDDSDVWRYQLISTDVPGFRRKMTARGRGAGGVGEILVLRWWRPAGQEGHGLRISSSRRPGTLNLEPPRNLAVGNPDPEVFLPLWPLSQFFDTR
ncbi:MAG: hypothetical protein KAH56_06070 [Candidatus Krumholzibacteria bacterium]|nr:hypothetical protein [Candidatus Krumholzibacteria bacterium]